MAYRCGIWPRQGRFAVRLRDLRWLPTEGLHASRPRDRSGAERAGIAAVLGARAGDPGRNEPRVG